MVRASPLEFNSNYLSQATRNKNTHPTGEQFYVREQFHVTSFQWGSTSNWDKVIRLNLMFITLIRLFSSKF